jgi:hypothetical protein
VQTKKTRCTTMSATARALQPTNNRIPIRRSKRYRNSSVDQQAPGKKKIKQHISLDTEQAGLGVRGVCVRPSPPPPHTHTHHVGGAAKGGYCATIPPT